MKTTTRNLLMAIMMMAVVILPSCSNDDEPSNISSIVGTWEMRFQMPGMPDEPIIRYTFNKNGSFEFYTKVFETEYNFATGTYTILEVIENTQTGKWSTSGNKLTAEGYDEDGEYYKTTTNYSIKGKELTIDSIEEDGTIVPLTFTKVK